MSFASSFPVGSLLLRNMGFPVPCVFGEGSCPLVPALKARLLLNLGILRLLSQQKSFKRFGLPELVYRMKVECVFCLFCWRYV